MTYQFETKPFAHQLRAFEDSWAADYYALFMEMGTGKTKVAIDTIAALYESGDLNAALIVAPKGVYDNWVKGEIPVHMPGRIDRLVVRWIPAKTKKFEEELEGLSDLEPKHLRMFVMNVEALSTPRGARAAYDFLKRYPNNIMVVDESTTIKNRTAQRTKNIVTLGTYAKYRRILTGSPVTKSPLDLYSQCMFLSDRALGFKSYFSFQNRYAVVQRRTMGPKAFQEIVGYRRLDELSEKLDTFSNRVLKEDCLDLPDKVYIRRDVPLTPDQKRLYDQMKKLALAMLDNGELATTASVLTQIMRLQQICCGFLTPDDGETQEVPHNRLNELMDIAEEVQGKVIILRNASALVICLAEIVLCIDIFLLGGETPPLRRLRVIPHNALAFVVRHAEIKLRTGVSLFGGATPPFCRLRLIWQNTLALRIRLAEIKLCFGQPLLGGAASPLLCFRVILRNTLSHVIHHAEGGLRVGVSRLRHLQENSQLERRQSNSG